MATKIEWAEEYLANKNKRVVTKEGYCLVRVPSYPKSNSKGYVLEHRIVMAIELGRVLECWEVVHHINGIRHDNRIKKLELKENGQHVSEHQKNASQELIDFRSDVLRKAAQRRKLPRTQIPCACGCGLMITTPDKKGRQKLYVLGHNARGKSWKWKTKNNKDHVRQY